MEDVVQFPRNVHEVAYVVVEEGELWIVHLVLQILHVPRNEVIHAHYLYAFGYESVTEV